ncbi:unnamed protein product [Blepharisma stoltei]|uniref:Dual specificity protein phosphatase n=1 Tax=Blepharisma stoltei TaxID=1481888 RepID=A0AAU9JH76_9CILI|nr:unnamed protein product [Blepharisma stoltei]
MSEELIQESNPIDVLKALRSPISQIDDIVYMGNRAGAQDLRILKSTEIKRILQIQSWDVPPLFPNDFIYHCIVIGDLPDNDISRHIPDALRFIADAIKANQKVFVHCDAGASRSGSIVIAYLMGRLGISFDEGLKLARKGRACVWPNPGFVSQLKQLSPSQLSQYFF